MSTRSSFDRASKLIAATIKHRELNHSFRQENSFASGLHASNTTTVLEEVIKPMQDSSYVPREFKTKKKKRKKISYKL
jgi:mannitol/fructose-specific phosphotransferase system IIA component (Ntr-type)